jgi:hypothetical protein
MRHAFLLATLAILSCLASGCAERAWYTVEFRDASTHEPLSGATAAAEAWDYTFFVDFRTRWTPDATLTATDGTATVNLFLEGFLYLKHGEVEYRALLSPGRSAWDGTRRLWPARDIGVWYRMNPYPDSAPEVDVRVLGKARRRNIPSLPWRWWNPDQPAPAPGTAPQQPQPERSR